MCTLLEAMNRSDELQESGTWFDEHGMMMTKRQPACFLIDLDESAANTSICGVDAPVAYIVTQDFSYAPSCRARRGRLGQRVLGSEILINEDQIEIRSTMLRVILLSRRS